MLQSLDRVSTAESFDTPKMFLDLFLEWVGLNDIQMSNPKVNPSDYDENEKSKKYCPKICSNIKQSYCKAKSCILSGTCKVRTDNILVFETFTMNWFLNAF